MAALFVLLALLLTGSGASASSTVAQLVQGPVWRSNPAGITPLAPGEPLAAGDTVFTGVGARAVLALPEGSVVKLGAEARLVLAELTPPRDTTGVFRGFLDVIRGAFRFTTTVVGRHRDVRARIGSATIGIRGTDVWGKREQSRDFAVLLEGRVSIERDGVTTELGQPNSLYMAPRGRAPLPVAPVDPADLARWAAETEPGADAGRRQADGRYRLVWSARGEAAARELRGQLADLGVASVVSAAATGWRVVAVGYVGEGDAQAAVRALPAGVARPWIAVTAP